MLRLLIVAQDAGQEAEMVRRASAALDRFGGDAAVFVSARTPGASAVARLDVGLFTRPLPDRLVVVGRDASCAPAALASLDEALGADLAAVVPGSGRSADVTALLEHGGAFRGGPLCQIGGFDGDRPVVERLREVGFGATRGLARQDDRADVRSLWAVPA